MEATYIDDLPSDILREILGLVSWRDRVRCSAVCRRWYEMLCGPHVWSDMKWRWPLTHRLDELAGDPSDDPSECHRLARRFGLGPGDAASSLNIACAKGNKKIVLCMISHFGFTTGSCYFRDLYTRAAFCAACKNGHLGIAQLLVDHFSILASDVRADDCAPLVQSCMNGHLAVAQWLTAHFDLAAKDVRAQWSTTSFGLAAYDIRNRSGALTFRLICEKGHIEVAQWFAATFHLSAACMRCWSAVGLARWRGHTELADWLDAILSRAPGVNAEWNGERWL